MATEVIMPKAGMAMEEGTIVKWLKKEGDFVEQGEILLEILTDKMNMEVEAEVSGTLIKILVSEGETIPVLEPIGYIGEMGEVIPGQATEAKGIVESSKGATESRVEESKEDSTLFRAKDKKRATPAARYEARKKQLSLEEIKGTGPKGRIQKADVLNHRSIHASPLASKMAKNMDIDLSRIKGSGVQGKIMSKDLQFNQEKRSATVEKISMSPMRKIIAKRMVESYFKAPVFSLEVEVDMTETKRCFTPLRDNLLQERGIKLTITDLILMAVAKSLQQYPQINRSLQGEEMMQYPYTHIALAVGLDEGLVVPVIKNVDTMSLGEIASAREEITQKSLMGNLEPEEMEGSTFTISNLGMYGIKRFTSIINQPNSAILGVGVMEERVVAKEGEAVIRSMMNLILTVDHRVIDGAVGAQFLQKIKRRLENPLLNLL